MSRRFLTRIQRQYNLIWNSRYCMQTKVSNDNKELNIDMDNASESAMSAFKTLYMRYIDTLDDKPILNDKLSSQYLNSFTYSPHHLPPTFPAVCSVLEPYRAKIIDMNVIQWIEGRYANHIINIENKTKETKQIIDPNTVNMNKCVLHIIELGVGFDTRFERIFLSESNQNKRIEHDDYFMNEAEKIQEDDDKIFDKMFNKMPSIAEMDNTISYNDYDIIYYYEIDFNEIIEIRKQLIEQNKINQLIYQHNNEYLLNYEERYDSDNIFKPKVMQNLAKKVYRKMYSYSVNDINWFDAVKKDIIYNHKKETGQELNKSFRNICIVSESLFLFIKKHEMRDLIENCCNIFSGAQFLCDESFTNEGLMNIEKDILNKYPMSYDINNKVFLLKLKEVNERLSFLVRWTVGFLAKNNTKILAIQFMKPITNTLNEIQL